MRFRSQCQSGAAATGGSRLSCGVVLAVCSSGSVDSFGIGLSTRSMTALYQCACAHGPASTCSSHWRSCTQVNASKAEIATTRRKLEGLYDKLMTTQQRLDSDRCALGPANLRLPRLLTSSNIPEPMLKRTGCWEPYILLTPMSLACAGLPQCHAWRHAYTEGCTGTWQVCWRTSRASTGAQT